ncbi:metal-dependent phosphohydrolase [Burkholderia aenigmatica]|uniref:Metal-dependent phosphohydrolase n=1 Tax=Burkholderia aenigmatica TaxID=2015348 RepID=A0A6P2HCM3_9BURK|nr:MULTISPECIES: AAA family ATPase [Burkholderia]VWB14127.1 metal-dependent phosphohydrolase [Burkholderia aenigmatica]
MNWNDIRMLVPVNGAAPDFDACLEAFPALEFAKKTLQGRFHLEGSVWVHTQLVVNELLALADYQAATRADQEILFLAALLHDIAKYSTTVIDPVTGNISQPGHSRKGAIDARIALWDAGTPFDVREAICRLVSVHQVPFHAFEQRASRGPDDQHKTKTPEFRVRQLSWQVDLRLLATLAEADMRGRICDDKQKVLDNIELFRELAREERCYGQPRSFADAHTRVSYFRGADVHPDYPLFQEAGSKVVVMSGLPASGKNTWVSKHHPGLPVVSFDDSREELGLRHGKNEGMVAHHAVNKAKDLLRASTPFVWNATNTGSQLREKALSLLYAYHAEVEVVYLERPRAELFSRNTRRDTSLTNKGIESMLLKWEPPLPTEAHAITYLA